VALTVPDAPSDSSVPPPFNASTQNRGWHAPSAAATFLLADGGSAYLQAATLALIFALVALPSCFVWLAFGAVIQRGLGSSRALRIFNIAIGALLAASLVLLIV
jgi:threonine/homoserine/homoserine lactone efflux protein